MNRHVTRDKASQQFPELHCWIYLLSYCRIISQIYHMDCAALPQIQLSLYLCPAMVTCIIRTPGSFLRLLIWPLVLLPCLRERDPRSTEDSETEEWMTSYPITCHLYTGWCRDLRRPHETSNYTEKDSDHRRGIAHFWVASAVVFMS